MNKIERGPKAPKPRTKTEAFRFTPHSLLNKAHPRALGRSDGSFPLVLFPPRERRTEEVCQAGGALVILTVLSAGAPSHCSSHKLWQLQLATTGPALRGQSGLSGQVSPHSNYVRGSFAFARSREILRVLRPRFHRRGRLVHRYYQKVSCLRYSY